VDFTTGIHFALVEELTSPCPSFGSPTVPGGFLFHHLLPPRLHRHPVFRLFLSSTCFIFLLFRPPFSSKPILARDLIPSSSTNVARLFSPFFDAAVAAVRMFSCFSFSSWEVDQNQGRSLPPNHHSDTLPDIDRSPCAEDALRFV